MLTEEWFYSLEIHLQNVLLDVCDLNPLSGLKKLKVLNLLCI